MSVDIAKCTITKTYKIELNNDSSIKTSVYQLSSNDIKRSQEEDRIENI